VPVKTLVLSLAVLAFPGPITGSSAEPSPPLATAPVETPAFRALLSPNTPGATLRHVVESGETLGLIARRYGATLEVLGRLNGPSRSRLKPGQVLHVPAYRFTVLVDKASNRLMLLADGRTVKTYVVATGVGNNTPVGVFTIAEKIVRPTWYRKDKTSPAVTAIPYGAPGHLLGTRWMGLSQKGYGIHGTIEPWKLGQQVSHGCIRMRNEEVEELFTLLPSGAQVTIVDGAPRRKVPA